MSSKHSGGRVSSFFPLSILLDLGARLPGSFQLGSVSFCDLCWVHRWIPGLVIYLRSCSDVVAGERDEKKTLIKREMQQGHAGRGINSPPVPPNTSDRLICGAPAAGFPGGLRTTQGRFTEPLHLYSQLVHLFSANFAVTPQTDQSCDLLSAGRWEPPLALPIFKQLKLFCIS